NDPIGTKGARLTSHISIPGRHLVFMPTVDHVGISRRIANEKERRRLREIVDRLRPPGTGFIVRTVAENVPQEKLESDIRFLIEVWNETVRRNEKRGGPGLLHPDLDLILRATRDLFAQDVESLVIDDRDEYERVLSFVTAQDPALKDRVLLHDSEEPIFDAYGIEQEINRAVQRKVWLKSGGYLIFDQAEALTAIDVNSGRYVGKKSLEETITKINVEAAREIVYQLRLRNIGGIIICDFIDMEKPQNRDKVFKTLQEALGRDKAKTNVLRISELGLIEMTRKRVRESIGRMLHEDCSYCDGQGFVKTTTTVCYEIFRELRRESPAYKDPNMVVNCSTDVAAMLQGDERLELRHLMDRYNKTIQIKAQANYHREQYDIYGRSLQGGEHKVASSAEVFEPANYGAPKRSGGENRNERQDRGRDRGRGRGGSGGGGGGGGGDRSRDQQGGGRRDGGDRNRGPQGQRGQGGPREPRGEQDKSARADSGSPPGQPPPEPPSAGDAGPPPEPPVTVGGD
ncbi:MAG: Rne/Rng family ribonuclease, partial [Myxococcaceae bacterium]